jgi:hypothetical protein
VSIDGRHIGPDGRLLQSHHNNRSVDVEQVGRAQVLLASGATYRRVREQTGLSVWTIGQIATGRHWAVRESATGGDREH